MNDSCTMDKWWNNKDLSSNCHFLIPELPVLHVILHTINKLDWELKQECKYYTQMPVEAT